MWEFRITCNHVQKHKGLTDIVIRSDYSCQNYYKWLGLNLNLKGTTLFHTPCSSQLSASNL
jgi:hypothetical protein